MRIDEITDPIVKRILSAFEHSGCPGKNAFPILDDTEVMDAVRRLRGRTWQELQVEDLLSWGAALDWLSGEVLQYYLPAYLAVAVAFPGVARAVSDAVVRNLAPPGHKHGPDAERFRDMVRGLTAEQKSIIRDGLVRLGVNVTIGIFSFWAEPVDD